MLNFEIVQQDNVGRTECAICLLKFDLALVMVRARGERNKAVYLDGYVCERCLGGGRDRIARELKNHAECHRRAAKQFNRWAREPFEMPDNIDCVLRSSDPLWNLAGKPPISDEPQ
jgi:hypothetical protein